MDEQQPKVRWFQYRLKTLFLLTLMVGLALAFYLYWDGWRKQRWPYQLEPDYQGYEAAINEFFDDVKGGRLDHAYASTSARFKAKMNRNEFETMVNRFLALRHEPSFNGKEGWAGMPMYSNSFLERNWSLRSVVVSGPHEKKLEFAVWAATDVADDSFFHRRPPPPKVEEIQVREFTQEDCATGKVPQLHASWEQEPPPLNRQRLPVVRRTQRLSGQVAVEGPRLRRAEGRDRRVIGQYLGHDRINDENKGPGS